VGGGRQQAEGWPAFRTQIIRYVTELPKHPCLAEIAASLPRRQLRRPRRPAPSPTAIQRRSKGHPRLHELPNIQTPHRAYVGAGASVSTLPMLATAPDRKRATEYLHASGAAAIVSVVLTADFVSNYRLTNLKTSLRRIGRAGAFLASAPHWLSHFLWCDRQS
jgi:hypothetical protein